MTESKPHLNRRISMGGDGVINTGDGSTILNAKGKNIVQGQTEAGEDLWLQAAADLTRIRERLENPTVNSVDPADKREALQAAIDLQRDLPGLQQSGPDALAKLKKRVQQVFGFLVPVAEIVGGLAGLEAIIQHH